MLKAKVVNHLLNKWQGSSESKSHVFLLVVLARLLSTVSLTCTAGMLICLSCITQARVTAQVSFNVLHYKVRDLTLRFYL